MLQKLGDDVLICLQRILLDKAENKHGTGEGVEENPKVASQFHVNLG